jgi:transposase
MNKKLPQISESIAELQQLMRSEKDGLKKQRLNALYLLVSQQAHNRTQVAALLGVHRTTVGRWLSSYETGGLCCLLSSKKAPGKTPLITVEIKAALKERLASPDGFQSYQQIQQFISDEFDVKVAYKTVHKLVYYKWNAKLKVPRRSHKKKRR